MAETTTPKAAKTRQYEAMFLFGPSATQDQQGAINTVRDLPGMSVDVSYAMRELSGEDGWGYDVAGQAFAGGGSELQWGVQVAVQEEVDVVVRRLVQGLG